MSKEDNGNGMSSYDEATGKSAGDESSLAARRARLRGTLAKQAVPPDPYVPDPYLNGSNTSSSQTPAAQTATAPQPAAAPQPIQKSAAAAVASEIEAYMMQAQSQSLPQSQVQTQAKEQAVDPPVVERRANNQPVSRTVEMSADFMSNAAFETQNAITETPTQGAPYTETMPEEFQMPNEPAPEVVPSLSSDPPSTAYAAAAPQQEIIVQDPISQAQQLQVQSQAIELLNSIDQAMGACAMNLSGLQKIAGEQTETLRTLADTMQNQSLFEIGLTLNTLTESLSAALEPMKAVGELVPAIDQLVSVLESREAAGNDDGRLSPDQLVTNLADQLSSGMIDPWTFKCAYMAVYPADHPADLLHRLVDLLGTQRLSGDLFRAAYDAVQAAEPPAAAAPQRRAAGDDEGGGEVRTIVKVVPDENMLAELEALRKQTDELAELRKQNDDLRSQGGDTSKKVEQREEEFAELLAAKEQELQEAQELLNSRWEEFNTRYDELTETLQKRDEMIQEKEAEVAKKESENAQLRAQVDELRDQTKEMFAEMQKQLMKPKEEPTPQAKPAGFFDPAPSPQQSPGLFEAAPGKPLFQPAPDPPAQAAPQMMQPQPQPQPVPQPMPQPQMAAPAPQPIPQPVPQPPQMGTPAPPQQSPQSTGGQAVPKPAPQPTTPFMTGAGSYGSGVRAQVFEVIVRQALAGAPWREICAGPMQVNNITADEVEAEVKRRQALLGKK